METKAEESQMSSHGDKVCNDIFGEQKLLKSVHVMLADIWNNESKMEFQVFLSNILVFRMKIDKL